MPIRFFPQYPPSSWPVHMQMMSFCCVHILHSNNHVHSNYKCSVLTYWSVLFPHNHASVKPLTEVQHNIRPIWQLKKNQSCSHLWWSLGSREVNAWFTKQHIPFRYFPVFYVCYEHISASNDTKKKKRQRWERGVRWNCVSHNFHIFHNSFHQLSENIVDCPSETAQHWLWHLQIASTKLRYRCVKNSAKTFFLHHSLFDL